MIKDTYGAKPLERFINLLAAEKNDIKNIYFFTAISGIIYLSLPLGIQSIINLLFGGMVSTSLIVLITIVVLGVLVNGWLQIHQMHITERIQRKIFTRLSLQFAYKIPRYDLRAIDEHYLPELVNRFFDTSSLQKSLAKILLDFPAATIQLLFGLLLLSFYHPFFIVFGVVLVVLVALILYITGPRGLHTSLEESNYKYEVGYWLEEMARIIKPLKFMSVIEFPIIQADKLVSHYLDSREAHFKVLLLQYRVFVGFKVIITAIMLTAGSYLLIDQQINIGQFIASEIVILTVLNSVEKLISSLDMVYDLLTSLEKIGKVLDKPAESEGRMILQPSTQGLQLSLEKVSYQYTEKSRKVIDELSFNLEAGESLCVFGTLGSGKTTLLRLLTGSYQNFQGKILIENLPVGNYNLHSLRSHIGVYLASADLFSGSLFDNISLGNPQVTQQQVLDTAQGIGLLPFIQSLKVGLHTEISSLGKDLPRNIVSKILLTRALAKKPKLLITEDCWHGLERKEQQIVADYIVRPDRNYSLIAVTNDMYFASKCDKILLLEEGRAMAYGSYAQVSNSEAFKRLFSTLSL